MILMRCHIEIRANYTANEIADAFFASGISIGYGIPKSYV